MKYLITGGAGFIGSNFIRFLLENDSNANILNIDKLTYAGNLLNLSEVQSKYPNRYMFFHGDICDSRYIEQIIQKHVPDYIINFAAETHVDRSIVTPNVFVETNVLGTTNLLNIANTYWHNTDIGNDYAHHKFIQISTDEVYGTLPEDKPELKFNESTPLAPRSPYSASKASADLIALGFAHTYGFPVIITRCSNNYGPLQFPEKLIPVMINNAVNGKSLPVYGDGMNIRDWLYVDDHCDAIIKVLEKGRIGQVYNIGGNNEIRNIDLVKMILKHLGKDESLIQFVKDRPGHDRRYAIDSSKIQSETGWKPKYEFEDRLKFTIDWYLNNKDWLESVKSGEYLTFYEQNYKNR